MTLVLSVVESGKGKGIDLKTLDFLNNAKLSGIWTKISDIHRSAITRARKKLDRTIFETTKQRLCVFNGTRRRYSCFTDYR